MAPYADSLAEDYSTHLAPLGYGRALYHPKSTMELHPGMLGFFDSYGEWTEILDLKDTASLQKRNLTLPSFELNSISTELRQWDEPRRSEGVSARTLHARAELEAAGLPVTSGFGLEFTLCQDSGAVLITSKDVQRSRLKVFESSVTSWLQSNLTTILSGELALPFKQSGFCVILGTYAVETFALDTWRGKDKSISCGLGANIASAGSVAGGLQVYRGHTTGAWMSGTAEKPDEKLVVFASGLRFTLQRSFPRDKAKSTTLRSGDDTDSHNFLVELPEGVAVVHWDHFGEDVSSDDDDDGEEQGESDDW